MVNIDTYKDFDAKENEHLIGETLRYQYAMNKNYNEEIFLIEGLAFSYIVILKGLILPDVLPFLKII